MVTLGKVCGECQWGAKKQRADLAWLPSGMEEMKKQIVLEAFARASWGAAVLRPYMNLNVSLVTAWFGTAELSCRSM
jgi:hypothetical protein